VGWATHGADVAYTFGALAGPDVLAYKRVDCPMTPQEQTLNTQMMGLWGAFARGGHAAISASEWPMYGADRRTLALQTADEGGLEVKVGFKKDDCSFWAAYPDATE
jgi:carboxylesterase type B